MFCCQVHGFIHNLWIFEGRKLSVDGSKPNSRVLWIFMLIADFILSFMKFLSAPLTHVHNTQSFIIMVFHVKILRFPQLHAGGRTFHCCTHPLAVAFGHTIIKSLLTLDFFKTATWQH